MCIQCTLSESVAPAIENALGSGKVVAGIENGHAGEIGVQGCAIVAGEDCAIVVGQGYDCAAY